MSRSSRYTSGTTGNPKGVMLTTPTPSARPRVRREAEDVRAGRRHGWPICRWRGSATRSTRSFAEPAGRLPGNCPESPETVQRDLRELGPTARAGAAADLGEHADRVQVRAADASPLKRRMFEYFRRGGRAGGDPARATASPCPPACACARRSASSSSTGPCAISSGCAQARGPHRRRAARARHLPLLPLDRRQPQAGLRLDRDFRARRRCSPTPRPTRPRAGRRARASRCKIAERGEVLVRGARCSGLLQERRGDARGDRSATAGSTPATPASSIRAATWSSSTAPRTSASSPTARPSRRSSSRTSSSSAPTSARRWPSATSGPFVAAMIAIDLEHGRQLGRAPRASPTPRTGSQRQKPEVRELIRDEIRKCNADAAGGPRSAASCCSTRTSRPTTPR